VRALAIDQGTSATKAIVLDDTRGVLADVDVPVAGIVYRGDAVEVDPLALWESIVTAGLGALQECDHPGVDVVGVGNQGETVLAWRRSTGVPVTPALVWQDRRASVVTQTLTEGAARLQAITGLPLDPYFAAPKMTWLRAHLLDPDLRADPDVVVTTIDAWVLHRMTGRFVTDAATASRTLLLDVASREWSPLACDAFGIALQSLPEVIACDASIGTTTVFGSEVPVRSAIVDQQAALFAQACRARGDAKCTYGTGAFLLANVGDFPTASTAGLATSVAWQLTDGPTAYCVDGQVYAVGAAVRWLERLGVIDGPADVDALGGSVTDSAGVQFVPSLAGVGAPDWQPTARGAFLGLSLAATNAHLTRAVAEGIAAQVTLLVRAIEHDLGGRLQTLRVDGGLTRSRVVMQSQADLLGIPVVVYPHRCATAIGIGELALGSTMEWTPTEVFEPALPDDVAAERFAAWEAAYRSTLDEVPG
jgi:glycerol kinase